LALAVLLAGLSVAASAPLGAAAFAMLLPLAALVVGPRVELTRLAQAITSLGALVAGLIIARATALPLEMSDAVSERTLLFAMPTVLLAAVRCLMKAPVYGAKLTLVATLVTLTAAGRGNAPMFPALAAASIAFGLLALRAQDPGRASLRQLLPRHYAGAAFGLLVAVGLTVFSTWSLPIVRRAVLARIMARLQPQTGFSDSMTLGALSGMLKSETVALRVRGETPPLLRGMVLTRYVQNRGHWQTLEQRFEREVVETATSPEGSGFVEVERAQDGFGQPRVYFSALGAVDVVSSTGFLDRDRLGVLRPPGNDFAKRIWFRQGPRPNEPEPTTAELSVPALLGNDLQQVLLEWGVRDQPPHEKLEIIEARLAEGYSYSLDFERTPRVDPVIDFLRTHKQGHCEYFASAFALLARAARVPARVVIGYRAAERSPFGYTIVRDRDAHAWVEVWVDDEWQTYDPTPASDLPPKTSSTPIFSALLDGIRTAWEATDDWLEKRTAFEFSVALVLMVGALVLVRTVRNREARKVIVTDDSPKEMSLLAVALARAGLLRASSETLGSLSNRVSASEELEATAKQAIVGALARYQALRYGGTGDSAEVLTAMREAAQRLKR